jgi:hypothetical protein
MAAVKKKKRNILVEDYLNGMCVCSCIKVIYDAIKTEGGGGKEKDEKKNK